MYNNKTVLAIIPARGGSKEIKNKNLKKIHGKSLVKIAINLCRKIKKIDKIVVSSDSNKIRKEGAVSGLKTFYIRPKKLSGDNIGDLEVLIDCLKKTERYFQKKFDYIVMIQPTAPLRKKSDVLKAITKCIDEKIESVWSVSKIKKKYHPLKQLVIKKNYFLELYNKTTGPKIIRRQQLGNTYFRNGSVYVFSRKTILKKKTIYPKKTSFIHTSGIQISIDNLDDLYKVRKLLYKRK